MCVELPAGSRLMIVDDDDESIAALDAMLHRAGCSQVKGIDDPRHALPVFAAYHPDLVLVDLLMPHLDGFTVMQQIASLVPPGEYLPMVMMMEDSSVTARRAAITAGAKDLFIRPFTALDILLRIRNLLETRRLCQELQQQNQALERSLGLRRMELQEARSDILRRLATAAEYRDDVSGQHTHRVGYMAAMLASSMGLPPYEVEIIRQAAPLHDVGKIGIPDRILLKPGKLTVDEFEVMKTHTTIGSRILGGSPIPLLQVAEEIALTHHERWDGSGYFPWLAGDTIPLDGRIVAVADVFDALTHERSYKPAWPVEDAVDEIRQQSGRQFDPGVVEAFLTLPYTQLANPAAAASP